MQSNNKKTIEDVLAEIRYHECSFEIDALEVKNFQLMVGYNVRCNKTVKAVEKAASAIIERCFDYETLDYERLPYYFKMSLDYDDEEIDLFVGSVFSNSLFRSFITKLYDRKVILCVCRNRHYTGYEKYATHTYVVFFFDKEKFEEKCKEYNIDLKMR